MLRISSSATKILSLVLVICLLFSCAQTTEDGDNSETVTFTDALDREVNVAQNVDRVACLIGSFADVWMLAGGNVCATADDAWEDFGLDLKDAVNIGGAHSPSLELVIASDPDFVIASASTASNVEMKDVLENAGITVAYFDVDNFDDYLKMLDICTDITGRKDLYDQNGLAVKMSIENIKNKVKQINIPENDRKILLLRASSGFVKVKGSEGTILGEMLADLGLVNIADSDATLLENLSVESVIKQEPYRIFVVTMGSDTDKAMKSLDKLLSENPAWMQLEAIKENRLYVMDRTLFNIKPNAKWAKSYEKIKEILLDK